MLSPVRIPVAGLLILWVFLILIPETGTAAPSAPDSMAFPASYRSHSDSSGVTVFETNSVRFFDRFVDTLHVLYIERLRSERQDNMDGEFGTIEISAWRLPRRAGDSPLWQREISANEATVDRGMYKTESWGCCGEIEPDEYYSLGAGELLLRATGTAWVLQGMRPGPVLIGFNSTDPGPRTSASYHMGDPTVLGTLTAVAGADTIAYIRIWQPDGCSPMEEKMTFESRAFRVFEESHSLHLRSANSTPNDAVEMTLHLMVHCNDFERRTSRVELRVAFGAEGSELIHSDLPPGFQVEKLR